MTLTLVGGGPVGGGAQKPGAIDSLIGNMMKYKAKVDEGGVCAPTTIIMLALAPGDKWGVEIHGADVQAASVVGMLEVVKIGLVRGIEKVAADPA